MTWTLVNLFGTGATQNSTTKAVTFDPYALRDAADAPWLQATDPTPSQIFAALIKHAHRISVNSATDKTKGIVGQANFGEAITIETRDSQAQIYESYQFRIYQLLPSVLSSGIDPDNVL